MFQLFAKSRNRRRRRAPSRFPIASRLTGKPAWKQETTPKGRLKYLFLHRKTGAGEAIRTPDPNLGKVVLYP